jgi:rfaE bifunctional protein kinase chain/domain
MQDVLHWRVQVESLSKDRFLEIIAGLEGRKVLVLGDVMLDEYLWGNVSRVSPEAPVLVVEVGSESVRLGGAANVANNLAVLGAEPALVGVVGDDAVAQRFREQLTEAGISDRWLIIDPNRPTTVKTRVIAHNQQVVRIDRESCTPLADDIGAALRKTCESLLDHVEAVLFEDYDKGVLTQSVVREVIHRARRRGLIVTADPKFEHFFDYDGVTLLKPNQREAERVLGVRIVDMDGLLRMGEELRRRLGGAAILLTRGEAGMTLFDGEMTPIPTVAREVYDVSGAGDVVISVATLCLVAGATLKEAAIVSTVAAGVEVGKLGASSVSREEMIQFWEDAE